MLVCLVVLAGLAFEYGRFLSRRGPNTGGMALIVPPGLDARGAAEFCVAHGLNDSAFWLQVHFKLGRVERCLVPGAHWLTPATPQELVGMLCRTNSRPMVKVTFPEGVHRFAMADKLVAAGIVSREGFLAASSDRGLLASVGIEAPGVATSRIETSGIETAGAENAQLRTVLDTAEGFLFPATYELRRDSEPGELVKRFTEQSELRWKQTVAANPGGLAALEALGMTRKKIVTLASMVEKEAAVADERPVIASVFLNRLRDPELKRLQSDPTALYGCFAMPSRIPSCANFKGKASPELNRDAANPYSTYVIEGLPPGPIGNPGTASLTAVLSPARTNYRYFVAKGGGRHTFSASYPEHLEAVKRLRERHD